MEAQELQKLELYCDAFYRGAGDLQKEAHEVLFPLLESAERVPSLQYLLANSQNSQALLFAATGLTKVLTKHWNFVQESEKLDTRRFVLNYLYARGPELLTSAPVVASAFVRLLARVVKLAWLEGVKNQNVVQEVQQFLQGSTPHWVIGLTIFTELLQDVRPSSGPDIAQTRRTSISIRDVALSDIFKIAVQTLQQFHQGTMTITNPVEEHMLLRQVLLLVYSCLDFDFIGAMADEVEDEQSTILVPSHWSVLASDTIPRIFFDIYGKCLSTRPVRKECAVYALRCLVQLASLRKCVFLSEFPRRLKYIAALIEGSTRILETGIGLDDDDCFHEFCRLLGRINTANQLTEIRLASANAEEYLAKIFNFSVQALRDWKRLPNSKHYLLGVWTEMVPSILHGGEKESPELLDYLDQILWEFISSRMVLAEASASDEVDVLDNLVDNEVLRAEQLQVIATLCKCQYESTCKKVTDIFVQTREDALTNAVSQEVFQQKVIWLVYIIGAVISAHPVLQLRSRKSAQRASLFWNAPLAGSQGNGYNEAKGSFKSVVQMAKRVLDFMKETDVLPQSSEDLEMAYLYFMEHLRRLYTSESIQKMAGRGGNLSPPALYTEFGEDIISIVTKKIITNLRDRVQYEQVVQRSLMLIAELAYSVTVVHGADKMTQVFANGRILLECPVISKLLKDHQNPEIAFLRVEKFGRYRTLYYQTLTRLFWQEQLKDKPSLDFAEFVAPFEAIFAQITSQGLQNCKWPVAFLSRDLRGIAQACDTRDRYATLFDWLMDDTATVENSKLYTFVRAVEIWADDYEVTIPVLKFMVEFVHNKQQRVQFDKTSPCGILLFKVVAKILVTYGNRLLEKEACVDVYKERYKGLGCLLTLFTYALSGDYANFGVFKVYNDPTLLESLRVGFKLCLSIPHEDLQAYPKAMRSYYAFIGLVCHDHTRDVTFLPEEEFERLMFSLADGMDGNDTSVTVQCCTAVEHIVTYLYENRNKDQVAAMWIQKSRALRKLLHLILQLVMLSRAQTSVYSMSKPLLGLILLFPEDYAKAQEDFVSVQVPQRQERLRGSFRDLTANITLTEGSGPGLEMLAEFAQNLYNFAQSVRAFASERRK